MTLSTFIVVSPILQSNPIAPGVVSITLIRTMPVVVWAMFFVTVQAGAFAGVLAISVTSVGMISKLFIEAIEDIDKAILEALDSTGATIIQKIRYGIIPQLTASFLSTVIYRFEINVKNATILGMVGAGGIGFTLIDGPVPTTVIVRISVPIFKPVDVSVTVNTTLKVPAVVKITGLGLAMVKLLAPPPKSQL